MRASLLVLAILPGLVYLAIYAVYRSRRRDEYDRYRPEHQKETLRRAEADSYRVSRSYTEHLAERERMRLEERLCHFEAKEMIRRAKWDADHGPLLPPLELKNREESRWPFNSAMQGAAAVSGSVLFAVLLWSQGFQRTTPGVIQE